MPFYTLFHPPACFRNPFISPFTSSSFIQAWHCGFENMVPPSLSSVVASCPLQQLPLFCFVTFVFYVGENGKQSIWIVLKKEQFRTPKAVLLYKFGEHDYLNICHMNSPIQRCEISRGWQVILQDNWPAVETYSSTKPPNTSLRWHLTCWRLSCLCLVRALKDP